MQMRWKMYEMNLVIYDYSNISISIHSACKDGEDEFSRHE